MLADIDIRQPFLFVAGWTLGSIHYLANAGFENLTYFETVGPKGVMASAHVPKGFPAKPFPVYHVLCDIADFAGGHVLPVVSSDPLSVVGLGLTKDGKSRLLVANLSEQPTSVVIHDFAKSTSLTWLDGKNVAKVNQRPRESRESIRPIPVEELTVAIDAYGIARIDTDE